jgi:hypothetical protein
MSLGGGIVDSTANWRTRTVAEPHLELGAIMATYDLGDDVGFAATEDINTFRVKIDGVITTEQATGLARWLLSWTDESPLAELLEDDGLGTG